MSDTPTFSIGDGATVCYWSDRHAGTIVSATPKRVVWQRDNATRTDNHGMSDAQSYEYSRDETGNTKVFTLRSNGKWVQQGETMRGGTRLVRGRHEHYDFSY